MQFKIGCITTEHLEAAASLNHRGWHTRYGDVFPAEYLEKHGLDHFRAIWLDMSARQARGEAILLGAFDDKNHIVGIARISKETRGKAIEDPNDLEGLLQANSDTRRDLRGFRNPIVVSGVYVEDKGQGIGSQLMNVTDAVSRVLAGPEGGIGVLWVADPNPGQAHFYEKTRWAFHTKETENRGGKDVELSRYVKLVPALAAGVTF